MNNVLKLTTAAAVIALLAGCEANGGGGSGGTNDDCTTADGCSTASTGGAPTNSPAEGDGGTTTVVYKDANGDGEITDDEQLTGNFVCDYTVPPGTVTKEAPTGGLVGGVVGDGIVGGIGGAPITSTTARVIEAANAIDQDFETRSTFTSAASALGDTTSTVGQLFFMGTPIPPNDYAMYYVTFPGGTADVGLSATITVTTLLKTGETDENGDPPMRSRKPAKPRSPHWMRPVPVLPVATRCTSASRPPSNTIWRKSLGQVRYPSTQAMPCTCMKCAPVANWLNRPAKTIRTRRKTSARLKLTLSSIY